jgi:hypothetical protein
VRLKALVLSVVVVALIPTSPLIAENPPENLTRSSLERFLRAFRECSFRVVEQRIRNNPRITFSARSVLDVCRSLQGTDSFPYGVRNWGEANWTWLYQREEPILSSFITERRAKRNRDLQNVIYQ